MIGWQPSTRWSRSSTAPSQGAPAIRKGAWILDASSEVAPAKVPQGATAPLQPQKYGPIHSGFYRVVGVVPLDKVLGAGWMGLAVGNWVE